MVEIEYKTVTEERIEEIITAIDPGNIPTSVMVDRIITAVCEKYNVSPDDLKSKNKSAHIANARHVAIYLIRTMTQMQYKQIGNIFGSRDHSTVKSSEDKVKINIKTVKNFETELNELIKKIRG
jgi:chromosomal replication initiator protein